MKYNIKTIDVKAKAILKYETNLYSKAAIAREFGVNDSSLKVWINNRDKILARYYSSKRDLTEEEAAALNNRPARKPEVQTVLIEEEPMPRRKSGEELLKENRELRTENEAMADKVAYYEALLDVLGIKPSAIQKKSASKQLEEQQKQEEEDM